MIKKYSNSDIFDVIQNQNDPQEAWVLERVESTNNFFNVSSRKIKMNEINIDGCDVSVVYKDGHGTRRFAGLKSVHKTKESLIEEIVGERLEEDAIQLDDCWQCMLWDLVTLVTGDEPSNLGDWQNAIECAVRVAKEKAIEDDRSHEIANVLYDNFINGDTSGLSLCHKLERVNDYLRDNNEEQVTRVPKKGEQWDILGEPCVIADIGGLKAVCRNTGEFWDCDDEMFMEHGIFTAGDE